MVRLDMETVEDEDDLVDAKSISSPVLKRLSASANVP